MRAPADPVGDPRGDLVRALPPDVAHPPAGRDEPPAGHVEEQRLLGLEARMGDEAPGAARDDAALDARAPGNRASCSSAGSPAQPRNGSASRSSAASTPRSGGRESAAGAGGGPGGAGAGAGGP